MTESPAPKQDRSRIRRDIRRLRRSLGMEARVAAEKAICRRIQNLGPYHRARSIAVFLAFDGEPSLARLAEIAARQGKSVYAPVLTRRGMFFAAVTGERPLSRNLFGIEEPDRERLVDARKLDLVLTPLVAFDRRGVRLGMGRGYYDRALRFLRHRRHWTHPKLLGVAYSFQMVDDLEQQPWDIPLWGAVTETDTYRFAGALE
ncbi:MAG TPA: 5-formyltetrahydrofolate cyclo-ligase [Gammaproteobacteria bacterium]|nr:5-formyltetrahydrofolate cyclo-ligase [Gammaproteobacteria bacterium]